MYKLGSPEVDPIPEALMAAAAAAAEAAGKLPRAAGTRGVRNTPEKGELCLGGFSFLRLGNSELWEN